MKARMSVTRFFLFSAVLLPILLGRAQSTAVPTSQALHPELMAKNSKLSYSVGAYYYPWYYSDFHGGQYLRKHLVPPQEPFLGEYNDRDSEVIRQHLEWSRYAGIEFWVASWWGPGGREDITILNHILPHPNLGDFKIAAFYETAGRTNDFTDYSNLGPDITYLAQNYFGHPNYLKIDGKPVLFIYLTRVLTQGGTLESSLDTIRSAAAAEGYSLFIVGDQVFGTPPGDPGNVALLDAITNYDVYGSMGANGYATQTFVDEYYSAQAEWKALASSVDVGFIPAVTPGFNDSGVREGHAPLSRQLTPHEEFGSLFRAMVQRSKEHTDVSVGRMIMVTSWNEWHEDTQIEPIRSAPATNLDDSATGSEFTNGLSYEGYEGRYLQILRDVVNEPPLSLRGTSADQAILLTWKVNTSLPSMTTWRIDYESQTSTPYPSITDIISSTRAYRLADLTNYAWYTVTLSAMLDISPLFTDTVRVMPTDHILYLPLLLRNSNE